MIDTGLSQLRSKVPCDYKLVTPIGSMNASDKVGKLDCVLHHFQDLSGRQTTELRSIVQFSRVLPKNPRMARDNMATRTMFNSVGLQEMERWFPLWRRVELGPGEIPWTPPNAGGALGQMQVVWVFRSCDVLPGRGTGNNALPRSPLLSSEKELRFHKAFGKNSKIGAKVYVGDLRIDIGMTELSLTQI